MGPFKALVKLCVLLTVGAAVVGVVVLLKRHHETDSLSFDEWPDVPRNPAA